MDGRVIVGNGRMTTDGMTFYQMAMLEYLIDASVDEIGDAALFTLKVFNKKTRLPYSVEMGFLALMLSTTNQKSAEKFVDTVCRIARESPPPSWRKLQGVNPISSRAYRYFENLKKIKPKCLY
ncbi:hypothetical protein C0081_20430 [Cohaesibacter celericrescens]|uniref:Uncharacterized protein n=2 Tax=Cohaesibacter celericrescens TaxID=2067669 RepID=A0A2N5XL23_9HYPH|nr:hypothetical protein C0081_20430 [Cohaesibacter celericrescens]